MPPRFANFALFSMLGSMRPPICLAILLIFPALLLARDEALSRPEAKPPATAPATKEADFSEPKAVLKTLGRFQDAGDLDKALSVYQACNDEEMDLAKALATCDVAIGKLRNLSVAKFGPGVASEITHAMRDVTTRDIEAAAVKITGNAASVSGRYFLAPLGMIKVNGQWKISVAKMIEDSQGSAEEMKEGCDDFVGVVEATIVEIDSGKYVNFSLMQRAVKRRIFKLMGEE